MAYRLRYVVLVGVGVTFVLAHLGQFVSPWAAWGAPVVVAAVVGAVVAEGNDGAGAGALAAGGGGFLFVFGNLLDTTVSLSVPLADAVVYSAVQGINTFALFGLVGMVTGGVAGLSAAYARGKAGEDGDADADAGDDDRVESADDDRVESADD